MGDVQVLESYGRHLVSGPPADAHFTEEEMRVQRSPVTSLGPGTEVQVPVF